MYKIKTITILFWNDLFQIQNKSLLVVFATILFCFFSSLLRNFQQRSKNCRLSDCSQCFIWLYLALSRRLILVFQISFYELLKKFISKNQNRTRTWSKSKSKSIKSKNKNTAIIVGNPFSSSTKYIFACKKKFLAGALTDKQPSHLAS